MVARRCDCDALARPAPARCRDGLPTAIADCLAVRGAGAAGRPAAGEGVVTRCDGRAGVEFVVIADIRYRRRHVVAFDVVVDIGHVSIIRDQMLYTLN